MKTKYSAFTLIELLVVISIIGILIGLSIFGLQGARKASRDAKRKADLEEIRAGIEIYKSDCGGYPLVLTSPLIGLGSLTACATTNTYIAKVPEDPLYPGRKYSYTTDGYTYSLCAALEEDPSPAMVGTGNCASCVTTDPAISCNYIVTNP